MSFWFQQYLNALDEKRFFAILEPKLMVDQSTGRIYNQKQNLYEIQYYHPWTLSRMWNHSYKFIMSDETCILDKVESSSPHLNKQVQVWRRRPDRKHDSFFQRTTYLGPMGMLIGGFTKRTERPWVWWRRPCPKKTLNQSEVELCWVAL